MSNFVGGKFGLACREIRIFSRPAHDRKKEQTNKQKQKQEQNVTFIYGK